MPRRPVRIANCSGFYGDRMSAAHEMVTGGPIDVLTGDWLAELTMLLLAKQQARGRDGWAATFLPQLRSVLAHCLDRDIRIVTNAGGLDPVGLATAVEQVADELGRQVTVAHVTGDDLRDDVDALAALQPAGTSQPMTANVYLGGWGITRALAADADVVVTGRVTDAAVVTGAAAWWHGWKSDAWDQLAGAVVAAHVIECGTQVTGGNFCFLDDLPDDRLPGFPLAEIAADGSAVITKHPGTGGLVSPDTVTAQLLYEIGAPGYLGPDVVAHFDTIRMAAAGSHRVALSGVVGSAPPPTLKVAVTEDAGYRATMAIVLTGLDIAAKATRTQDLLLQSLGPDHGLDVLEFRLVRFDRFDAASNVQATAHLQVTAMAADRGAVDRVGRALVEQALAGVAGFHATTPPPRPTSFGRYHPATIDRSRVAHRVVVDGHATVVADPPTADPGPSHQFTPPIATDTATDTGAGTNEPDQVRSVRTIDPDEPVSAGRWPEPEWPESEPGGGGLVPLGRFVGARSGDKGGNANLGVWVRDPGHFDWLVDLLTVDRVRGLLGIEATGLRIDRHVLANLHACNFVVHGLLGDGVASTTRPDPQAKGLGEYLRSRLVAPPT